MKNLDLTANELTGRVPIAGDLDLDHLTEIPEGFTPKVGGSLWLRCLEELPPDFAPTVEGDLHLDGLRELPAGFAPTVGGDLWLGGLRELPPGFAPTVGCNLYLSRVNELPPDFAPKVCGVVWTPRLHAKKLDGKATYLVTERKFGSNFTDSYVTDDIYSFVEQHSDYDLGKDYYADELEEMLASGSDVRIYEIDDEKRIYKALSLAHIINGPAEEIFARLEKRFGEER